MFNTEIWKKKFFFRIFEQALLNEASPEQNTKNNIDTKRSVGFQSVILCWEHDLIGYDPASSGLNFKPIFT